MLTHRTLRHTRYLMLAVSVLMVYYLLQQTHGQSSVHNLIVDNNDDLLGTPKLVIQQQQPPSQGGLFSLFSKANMCPNYVDYSQTPHEPRSNGPLKLPFQRPDKPCRTYSSNSVEKIIDDFKLRIADPDLAMLFENCLPNTLDTTILWHHNATRKSNSAEPPTMKRPPSPPPQREPGLRGASFDMSEYTQSFIVTGDIHAEWLRDSAWQLSVYQPLAKYDQSLKDLITGAINTQARYIVYDPYCNAFQPPPESGIERQQSAIDKVFPRPNWDNVFECKWEVDSLASFLALSNQYYAATGDASIFNDLWQQAFETIFSVIKRQRAPTFNANGNLQPPYYGFQRDTNIGSETLPLSGTGNPVNFNTKLIRSAFRPSDDACIFQLFVPGNAFMTSELFKLAESFENKPEFQSIHSRATNMALALNESIYEFGVVDHPVHGKVFAYEIDGYNSALFMDDANIPSLLSLPDLGFIDRNDPLYQNTRKMVLDKKSNPYCLTGKFFEGIGGPHVGYRHAWPMSLCVKIRTSDDDEEIKADLAMLLSTTGSLGLMHEGVNVLVAGGTDYTRSWFSWCNSEFGKTILDLAKRKPHLIFKEEYKDQPYVIDEQFKGLYFD
ncbi:hypothetical protein DASC09_024670 [Saccharomycopsis crataegensis]|uniref:Uncharacterized protein n=1 Tax=Saccharomycopsis crataegensis TaxID=43959 RepID=A0AAV5QK17_9ASCO|nr:hypothetical protein DASC09_024670 [Saccharomycopsis crataegensis]